LGVARGGKLLIVGNEFGHEGGDACPISDRVEPTLPYEAPELLFYPGSRQRDRGHRRI